MTVLEFLIRMLAQVQPLFLNMAVVTAATVIALILLLILTGDVWVTKKSFRLTGFFLGLDGRACLELSCCWVKLWLLWSFLAGARKMTAAQYLLFLLPAVFSLIAGRGPVELPGRLVWFFLELAGLFSCNLICGYIRDLRAGKGFWVIYALMSVFTALSGLYVFLTEANGISESRREAARREEDEEDEETDGTENNGRHRGDGIAQADGTGSRTG